MSSVGRLCPLCGCADAVVLARHRYALFDDLELSGDKTIKQCSVCGMLYDDIPLSLEQLQRYYLRNEHYAATTEGGGGGVSPDNNARYDRILDALALKGEGLILDYGCGQGGFLARCASRGYRAAGIETSASSRAVGSAAGYDISSSFEEFAASHPNTPVRALVLSHVLEHLLFPRSVLSGLVSFAAGARVYIEVPDASYLGPGPVRWDQIYFEHLCHFRGESLAALARQCAIIVEDEGVTGFSPAKAAIPCRYIVGRCGPPLAVRPEVGGFCGLALAPLPEVPGRELPADRPLVLWGVSQYAMLLIGSNPQFARLHGLYDISAGKLGRSIGGMVIQHPAAVAGLPVDALLVIPSSPYVDQIRLAARQYGFRGNSIVV